MSKISIIIPTINEANNLPLLLSDLSSIQKEGEIIIVDSGSEDKTIDIANIYGAKVFISKERNRGLQLDIGAKNSKGEWLIFLHADTRLTHDWFKKINSFLKGNKNSIYYFEFKINHKKIIYRVLEILVNFRSKFFKQPYGDQGLIIHRTTYFKNNGFRKIPLIEDIDFNDSPFNHLLLKCQFLIAWRKILVLSHFLELIKIGKFNCFKSFFLFNLVKKSTSSIKGIFLKPLLLK